MIGGAITYKVPVDLSPTMRNQESGCILDSAIRELENISRWRPRKAVHFSPEVEKFFTLTPRYWSQEFPDDFHVPQDVVDSQSHSFKTRVFRNPHSCAFCKEIIWNEGRICRVCRFACHKKCEYKVMTQCLPQSPTANSPEVKSGTGSPFEFRRKKSSSSPPTPTTPTPPTTPKLQPLHKSNNKMLQQQEASPKLQPVNSTLQHQTAQIQHAPPQLQQQHVQQPHMQAKTIGVKSGDGLVRYSFDLEVDYITERLIAVSFPAGGLENQYRSNLRDVVRMLKSKHHNSYIIFNLSRRRHDITKLNQEVRDLGWPNVLAPPLERLCSICKQMETWMKTNPNNVVVLHCKGGRGPIGVVVSAYMHYINITSAGDSGSDRYAMSRFLDARARGTMHPSQLRYVDYFTGLLTNSIQINSSPLFLHHVVLHGVPNYDSNGGCRPFLRIYQGMHPVFTSGVYTVPEGTSRFVITPERALPLRGDILVKCYHKKFRSTTRDTVFRCQFHTTAVMEYRLIFQKPELDDACTDARFPEFTKVELIFSSTPDALHGSDYMAADTFPSEHIDDPLIRWDSYEHFNDIIEGPEDGGMDLDEKSGSNNNNNMILEIPHSSAPDGALYAQVKKTPSPEQSPMIPAHHPRPPPPLTNGDATSPTPYVLSPDRAPQVQPQREGKRHMDYRERMALDELLKGITGEGTDGGIVVNNNTQWKAPPSPDNQVLHHEPSLTRRIVSVSEDLRHAPIPQNKPKPAPLMEEEPPSPSGPAVQSSPVKKAPVTRKESSEAENPYAEITEAMQQQQQQQQQASPNPNTNPRGPYQETITPVVQSTREQAAPPMVNGGVNVPRTIEQHNPIYEVTKTASRGSSPNGQVTHNGGLIGNGQVNLNPGQNSGFGNPGHTPQSYGSPAGSYNPGQVGPVRPHIAQINGPVETPIVPNSISRVTERTPTLSRLQNGPTSPPMTQYEPRPLKAKEERFQLLKKDPNQPLHLQQQQPLRQQQQQLPSPTTPPQVSPVPSGSGEDEDGGMGWLKRQQDKLREKREREQGRPIFSSPSHNAERVPEPMRANSVNASPKLRVRFEGDPQSPGPAVVSPPVGSSFKDGSPSWLSQQQQKLQDRQKVEPAPISPMSYVTTESTPVFSSTTTPLRDQPFDAGRRGTPPAPLTLSSDLERSINELGHVDNAKPSQMYVQRTMTTRTTTTGPEWEPHERPLNRQLSDLTHDRVRDPVYQRPAVEQAPKVPATPGTPYDPVPPILTNAQLRGNGQVNYAQQEQHRIQSRSELASRVGVQPFKNAPVYVSSHTNPNPVYGRNVPIKVGTQASDSSSLSQSVDSGYKSGSYQTLVPSLSGVNPIESATDVTRYVGKDGSETTITNTTQKKRQTVQVYPVVSQDGSYHYPAIPVTNWKGDARPSGNGNASGLSRQQPAVNIRVNPYEEVRHFLPRSADSSRGGVPIGANSSQKQQMGTSTLPAGSLRSPTSAFVPITVSTTMGDHLYDTSILSSSSSSSTNSSVPASHHLPDSYLPLHQTHPHHLHIPSHQQSHNNDNGYPFGSGFHQLHDNSQQQYFHEQQSSINQSKQSQSQLQSQSKFSLSQDSRETQSLGSYRGGEYDLCPPKANPNYQQTRSYTPDMTSSSLVPSSNLTPSQTLLKSTFRNVDLLLSPSSVPSLSNPFLVQNEQPKVSSRGEDSGLLTPQGRFPHLNPEPQVEQPPRASSVPPTLPSYDWVMHRIRELRRGPNHEKPPSTNHGSQGFPQTQTRSAEARYDSSNVENKVHFNLRNEVISSSRHPKGHGTNLSAAPVVQPVPHRPVQPKFENLASLPPKGNSRVKTPQGGGAATLARKHHSQFSPETASINVPNRREEVERWNNYGYSYSGGQAFQPTAGAPPRSSTSTTPSVFSSGSQMGQQSYHTQQNEPHFRFSSNIQPRPQQPTQTERRVRTLNNRTVHVEASSNPSSSVSVNNTTSTRPPHPSMHGNAGVGRIFTRSVSNSGLNELLPDGVETNNNNKPGNEDAFSSLDDAVKMLSHWSNEIQKLSAPYSSSPSSSDNHNTHASTILDNRAKASPLPPSHQHHHHHHHQLNNNNQSDARLNQTQFQTLQSNGGYHYSSRLSTNHRPQATSTPKKEFDEVDLHIDEPAAQTNVPRGLVADRSPNFMDRSLSPPPSQPPQSRPPRRTNSQSGYDSDTGIQQYYRPPRRRNLIDPGAEVWLQNPGGLPRKENEFWNKTEGLKSPEASKAPEYDLSSSTESISGPKTPTPRFPVGPKAYANMMKTFIVKTGAPPHGPDQPLPLQRTMRRQDSDTFDNGPLPIPMGSAVAPEVYSPPPPHAPAPAPLVAPQPTWEEQPSYTERRVITVEQRSEPAGPSVWTPTPQPAPQAPRTTGPGDDPMRQLEYLEDEPWMGRKPILQTPPRRTTDPLVPEPWSLPPDTTTMITTGPVQTFPNGVPQTTTTTQWRTREFIQQPIDIKPIVVDVRQEEEGERRKRKERAFVPQYVREVNAAPPLPPSSPPQPQVPLPKLSPPEQPRVIPYSEPQPLPQPAYHQQPQQQQRIVEPPITEVRLHGVEVGPIQVVPVEAQVVTDRKGQYPTESTQQGMPAASMPNQVPTTTRTYQYQTQSAPVPQSYAPVTPPQASRGIVQTTSPPSYGTVQSAAAPPTSYSTVQQQVTPPMSYGTIQSSPQRAVVSSPGQDSTIIQKRVEVREITQTESMPVAHTPAPPQQQASPQLQQHLPLIQQQNQQQLQQELPQQPAPQDEQPLPTHNERLLNQPKPPVQYPTFSDRHRKAAKGPTDDSLPNGGAGYRTIYDNRRQQRASLGNEGQLPSPGGLSGKSALNGSATPPTLSGRSTPSNFYYTQRLSPYGSSSSLADPSVEHVRFVKDLSGWWYKPNISRDDAINILKDKTPGTFVVRDSNSFPGAFGLALKVAQIPANTTPRKGGDPQSELVRHFLIEPNARGVRLKGCANEPVFSSLSALVYQHTLTQLALPIKLVLPDTDPSGTDTTDSALDPKSAAALLQQGAACKVLYIDSVSMESLTGSEAIREALTKTLTAKKKPDGIVVHFKVSSKGITVTDTQRKLFFRKHYPVKSILYCGMDPNSRKCPRKEGQEVAEAKIFGFISRKPGSLTDNECHLFADWEVEQPASAIVSFVTKVMLGSTSSSRSSVKTP